MDSASVAQQCAGAHQDRQGWRARCPLHNGKTTTSLHIWDEAGEVRLHCFSGCKPADLYAHFDVQKAPKKSFRAIYAYHDSNGQELFQVVRRDGQQRFFQRRPNPSKPGEYVNDMKGVTRQLYRLPEIMMAKDAGQPVYIVEGEKDVETLREQGKVATTNAGGAGKWEDQYSASLDGVDVILLDDNDTAGEKHRQMIMTRLKGHVKSLTYIDLPDREDGEDVTDWLRTHTISELNVLVEAKKPSIVAPHLVFVRLEDVEREDIHWLWEPYIAMGKVTFLEGQPGDGKTYLALAIAAAVTRGYALPNNDGEFMNTNVAAAPVLYITAEDGLGDTIRPRAEIVEADLGKLLAVQGWSAGETLEAFNFQHIALLESGIRDTEAKLVVIDPIQAYLGQNVDMHRANEVRPIMSQVGAIAARTGCAILIIRHWTKAIGANARNRGLGSVDFTGIARSVLSVGESPEDDSLRVMAHAKSNISAMGRSVVFSIKEGQFAWYGHSDIDADTLAGIQPKKREMQLGHAMKWLKDMLHNGPVASGDLFQMAEAAGIKDKTLRRAKERINVHAYQEDRQWFWAIPRAQPLSDEPPF